ncbi:hypothetical protein IWW34DRAFT_795428 [Fusarium oxysporum f. sp. albedinis]|nr:hypothetical protein IWW34DRAFT_795428 [Fusarium oxysporum f. sp. albedinis]
MDIHGRGQALTSALVFFFFAWLASIGCFTVSCVFAQFPGFYVNIRDLRLDDLGKSLQLWLIFQYLFLITVAFIKISIWLEWCETLALNIFKKWTRIGSLGVMVLTGIILLISIALLIKVLVDGDCYDQDGTWGNWKRSFSVAVGVLGISQLFIDLVINLVSDSKDADIIWNIGNLQLFTHIAMTSWLLLSAGTCKPKTLKDIFRRRGRQNGVSSTKAQSSNFPNKNPQVGSGSSPDSCDNPSVSPIELEAGSQSVPRNAESQENLCEG